jgi:hypothetical protein
MNINEREFLAVGRTWVIPAWEQNLLQGIQPGQGQSGIYGSHGNTAYDPRQVEAVVKIRF